MFLAHTANGIANLNLNYDPDYPKKLDICKSYPSAASLDLSRTLTLEPIRVRVRVRVRVRPEPYSDPSLTLSLEPISW